MITFAESATEPRWRGGQLNALAELLDEQDRLPAQLGELREAIARHTAAYREWRAAANARADAERAVQQAGPADREAAAQARAKGEKPPAPTLPKAEKALAAAADEYAITGRAVAVIEEQIVDLVGQHASLLLPIIDREVTDSTRQDIEALAAIEQRMRRRARLAVVRRSVTDPRDHRSWPEAAFFGAVAGIPEPLANPLDQLRQNLGGPGRPFYASGADYQPHVQL